MQALDKWIWIWIRQMNMWNFKNNCRLWDTSWHIVTDLHICNNWVRFVPVEHRQYTFECVCVFVYLVTYNVQLYFPQYIPPFTLALAAMCTLLSTFVLTYIHTSRDHFSHRAWSFVFAHTCYFSRAVAHLQYFYFYYASILRVMWALSSKKGHVCVSVVGKNARARWKNKNSCVNERSRDAETRWRVNRSRSC